MAITYTNLQETTISGTSTTTITFSAIPATYSHLVINFTGHFSGTATAFEVIRIQVNNISSGTYSSTPFGWDSTLGLYGSGSPNVTNIAVPRAVISSSQTSLATSCGNIWIPNYANTNMNKVLVSHWALCNGSPTTGTMTVTGANLPTSSAISTITLYSIAQVFQPGTSARLYGLSA